MSVRPPMTTPQALGIVAAAVAGIVLTVGLAGYVFVRWEEQNHCQEIKGTPCPETMTHKDVTDGLLTFRLASGRTPESRTFRFRNLDTVAHYVDARGVELRDAHGQTAACGPVPWDDSADPLLYAPPMEWTASFLGCKFTSTPEFPVSISYDGADAGSLGTRPPN